MDRCDEMIGLLRVAADRATGLAKNCIGGGAERFRDARICASAVRAARDAAIDINSGYGGLSPSGKVAAIQSLYDTAAGALNAVVTMMPEYQHATDAGEN